MPASTFYLSQLLSHRRAIDSDHGSDLSLPSTYAIGLSAAEQRRRVLEGHRDMCVLQHVCGQFLAADAQPHQVCHNIAASATEISSQTELLLLLSCVTLFA